MYQLPMSEEPDLAKLKGDVYENTSANMKKLANCPVVYEGYF